MTVEFAAIDAGVRVTDRIEATTFELRADATVRPCERDPEAFHFPVERAVGVEASTLRVPQLVGVYARRLPDGDLVDSTDARRPLSLPAASYELELTNSPMKLYVRVDGPVSVSYADAETRLDFGETRELQVGARSLHERPGGTVTTTADPHDLMRAVSTFGSALQTTSPERSFPTLRGHPPLLDLGPELDVPESLRPPETGVEIRVPPTHEAVFTVSTLAYYLGATVRPGEPARVEAAGETHEFAADCSLAEGVARTLERQFLLDCVTRTEGFYRVDLAERRTVEDRTDLDFAALYDRPLDERVAAYLTVPPAALDDVVQWHLLTDVNPVARNAEILPFLANDLSHVRSTETGVLETAVEEQPEALRDFFRADAEFDRARPASAATAADPTTADFVRSAGPAGTPAAAGTPANVARAPTENVADDEDVVFSPPAAETLHQAWVGPHFPIGASKPTVESYLAQLDREPGAPGSIDITVVCNDEEMRAETEDIYGFRELLQFDIDVHHHLTTAEFRALLAEPINLLHFVGHVDESGFQCADGALDAATVEETGVDAFILNACRSYRQGLELVRAGSIGGVVTVNEVLNRPATRIGKNVARLLDIGFDLHGALDVATKGTLTGNFYSIVGNGKMTLSQSAEGIPTLSAISTSDYSSGTISYPIRLWTFPTASYNMGTMASFHLDTAPRYHVSVGDVAGFEVDAETLEDYLNRHRFPVLLNGELRWSDSLEVSEITRLCRNR